MNFKYYIISMITLSILFFTFIALSATDSGENKKANEYYKKGNEILSSSDCDYPLANNYFNKALACNPNHVYAMTGKGRALYFMGHTDKAMTAYNNVLKINKNDIYALTGMGDVWFERQDFVRAMECYKKVLENKELTEKAKWRISGFISLCKGNYDDSIKYLEKRLSLNPREVWSLHFKAFALCKNGKYQQGMECYNKISGINSSFAQAMSDKGYFLYASGEYEKGKDYEIKVIGKYENVSCSAKPCYYMGNISAKEGNFQQAVYYYDRALKSDPDFKIAETERKKLQGKSGNNVSSYSATPVLQAPPLPERVHFNKGNYYLYEERYEDAIKEYEQSISINPNMSESLYNLGVLWELKENREKAIENFQKYLDVNPGAGDSARVKGKILILRGDIYYNQLRYWKAIETFEEATEVNPDSADAYYSMGMAYDKVEKYEGATEAYKKAVDIAPEHISARYNLATHYDYLASSNPDYKSRAIEHYREYLSLFPYADDADQIRERIRLLQ